jgi:hypothetical protein
VPLKEVASPEGLGDQGVANVLAFPVAFVAGLKKTGTLAGSGGG